MNQSNSECTQALEHLKSAGAEHAQVVISNTKKTELNIDAGRLTLMRTTHNRTLNTSAIVEAKKSSQSLNQFEPEQLKTIAKDLVENTKGGMPDLAHSFAPKQEKRIFEHGPQNPDLDGMYHVMENFLKEAKAKFPNTHIEQSVIDHSLNLASYRDSNGNIFESTKGHYSFFAMFTSKDGKKTSSFNYAGGTFTKIPKTLMQFVNLEELLTQSQEQVETKTIKGKFVGDILITPHCLGDFLGGISSFLSDSQLISGTSIYKNKLNQKIAADSLTIHCKPTDELMSSPANLSSEGFINQDSTLIEKGVLKHFLLSQYGAKKTGLERGPNQGQNMVVDAGDKTKNELIGKIKRGILLCRFSGGRPSENGDISGVAKNSYYIEDGKILYPVSETMVSGNLADFILNIKGISQERINFGDSLFPWILSSNFTISGH